MTTAEIANKLVAMCRDGQVEEAKEALFAEDIISIEPAEGLLAKETKGMQDIREKAKLFDSYVEHFYSNIISDPVVAGDYFSLAWQSDLQMKGQPRINNSEICVYKVKDGKIISEQFFY